MPPMMWTTIKTVQRIQNNIGNGGDFDDTTNTNTTFDGKKPASDSFDASIRAHRNEARQIILEIFASVNTHPNATMAFVGKYRRNRKVFWSQRDDEFFITLLVTVAEMHRIENEARVLIEHFRCCHGVWSIRLTESFRRARKAERCLTDINDDVVHTALQCLQNIVSDGEKTDSDDALANAVFARFADVRYCECVFKSCTIDVSSYPIDTKRSD